MSNPDSPINDIFLAARRIENPTARAEYLDMACGGNTELRSQIERMLAAAVERATSTNKPPGTERESPAHFESTARESSDRFSPRHLRRSWSCHWSLPIAATAWERAAWERCTWPSNRSRCVAKSR